MQKGYLVYKQEFWFKVSYLIITGGGYIPSGAKFIGFLPAKTRQEAMDRLKDKLGVSVREIVSV